MILSVQSIPTARLGWTLKGKGGIHQFYLVTADADLCANSPCAGSCSETEDGVNFICTCSPGQTLADDGFSCSDADLCANSSCEGNCSETEDGTDIICSCSPGQILADDGFSCTGTGGPQPPGDFVIAVSLSGGHH
ncbi:fibulin-5 [Plakobranchus ocellatus]|uniref:Fibulin-5 n=1 Tax=Plakobranchus ocellatus TaxID=259542 RepID=A0AAV4CSS5_9GAST|nr:fibulin-5 [Plakobranchus ocellatus]